MRTGIWTRATGALDGHDRRLPTCDRRGSDYRADRPRDIWSTTIPLSILLNFVDLLFNILSLAILIRALLSWFNLPPSNPLVTLLYDITEPILAPLRRIVPRIGMMDITPVVAILLMNFIRSVLEQVLISARFF